MKPFSKLFIIVGVFLLFLVSAVMGINRPADMDTTHINDPQWNAYVNNRATGGSGADSTWSWAYVDACLRLGQKADSSGRIVIYWNGVSDSMVIDSAGIHSSDTLVVIDADTIRFDAGGSLILNGDQIKDFTGTGLALSSNALTTTLGTEIDTLEINDAQFNQYVENRDDAGAGGDTCHHARVLADNPGTPTDSAFFKSDTFVVEGMPAMRIGTGDGRLISRRGIFEYLTIGNEADTATADSAVVTVETLEDSLATRQMLDATLTDIADGTIAENLVNTANPWAVNEGGTGAATLTDGGILLGSGTGAITALGVATNGQIPIGDGTTDPVLATITQGTGITVTNGAGTITVASTLGTSVDTTELASSIRHLIVDAARDSGMVQIDTLIYNIPIIDPDAYNDTLKLIKFDDIRFPNGFELLQTALTTVPSGAYTLTLMEYSSALAWQATTDSLVQASGYYTEDSTPMNSTLDAGDYLGVYLPATDMTQIIITIVGYVK